MYQFIRKGESYREAEAERARCSIRWLTPTEWGGDEGGRQSLIVPLLSRVPHGANLKLLKAFIGPETLRFDPRPPIKATRG